MIAMDTKAGGFPGVVRKDNTSIVAERGQHGAQGMYLLWKL
jgi:hypothetical protein